MKREEFYTFVAEHIPDVKPGTNKQFAELIVPTDKIHLLATILKKEPATRMDYLFCQTAADRKDGLHMIYHVKSTTLDHTVMLKTILIDKTNPQVATVSDIWASAEFFEREIFDLFGIRFTDHPDLRRIFLDEEWNGHPLRKDYKDTFTLDH